MRPAYKAKWCLVCKDTTAHVNAAVLGPDLCLRCDARERGII